MAPRAVSGLLALGLLAAGCTHVAQSGRLPLAQVADLALPGDTSRFDSASLETARHRLFVSHLGASEVVVVDTSGPSLRGVIGGLPQVHGVLVLAGLGRVSAAVTGRNEVAVIDEESNSVVAEAPTGEYPDGLAFDATDNRAFVSNEVGGTLTAFDPLTAAVLGTVELGAEVGNVVYDPASSLLLVAVQGRNEIAVVDPRTLAVTARHHLDGCDHSHGLAVVGQQAFGGL